MAKKKPYPAQNRSLRDALSIVPARPLIAVSGGRDSMCLLHACFTAGLQPHAAHYNHRWSKTEDQWALFIEKWCKQHDIPFHLAKSPKRGPTNENTAREQRYKFLLHTCALVRSSCLLTAHHADDQAETLLMRLLRGTGPAGLGGIPARHQRQGVLILRPWLQYTREEITTYAKVNKIEFIEDPFNQDSSSLRVRVRSHLLPLMESLAMPGLINRLSRLSTLLRDDEEFLNTLASEELTNTRDFSHPNRIHIPSLLKLPRPIQRRIVTLWVKSECDVNLSSEETDKILELASSQTKPTAQNLPCSHVVRRKSARLFIKKMSDSQETA